MECSLDYSFPKQPINTPSSHPHPCGIGVSYEQGGRVTSSLDQYQPDELDVFAELDEIKQEICNLQDAVELTDGEKEEGLYRLRSHFAYLEHIAILTGDSARLEPEFHKIELELRCIEVIYEKRR